MLARPSGVVSAHQPNFLPYAGNFRKFAHSETVYLMDNVQYIKGDFANRNRIGINGDTSWVRELVDRYDKGAKYNEVLIVHGGMGTLITSLAVAYHKAPYCNDIVPAIVEVMETVEERRTILSDLNTKLIKVIAGKLDLKCKFETVSDVMPWEGKHTLIDLCKHGNAHTYLAGAGSRDYMQTLQPDFTANGIAVRYMPPETNLHHRGKYPRIPNLSIIDCIAYNGIPYTKIFLSDLGECPDTTTTG